MGVKMVKTKNKYNINSSETSPKRRKTKMKLRKNSMIDLNSSSFSGYGLPARNQIKLNQSLNLKTSTQYTNVKTKMNVMTNPYT